MSKLRRKPLIDRWCENVGAAPGSACWLWRGAAFDTGYGQIKLDGKKLLAHRVAYQLNIGPIPAGMLVCHKCDTPACVRPDHLFLGTPLDNMRDMWSKGRGDPPSGDRHHSRLRPERVARGEAHKSAKLKEADVLEIVRLLADGHSQPSIAAKFGVARGTVANIAQGKNWKSIERPAPNPARQSRRPRTAEQRRTYQVEWARRKRAEQKPVSP